MLGHFNIYKLDKERRKKVFFELQLVLISSIAPLASLPQIFKIWDNKSAGDLSLITWVVYILTAVFWIMYGVRLKSMPLLINNMLWLVVNFSILVGILRYG